MCILRSWKRQLWVLLSRGQFYLTRDWYKWDLYFGKWAEYGYSKRKQFCDMKKHGNMNYASGPIAKLPLYVKIHHWQVILSVTMNWDEQIRLRCAPAGDGCVTTPFFTLTQVAYQLRSFSQKLILLCFGGINYQLSFNGLPFLAPKFGMLWPIFIQMCELRLTIHDFKYFMSHFCLCTESS